AVPSRRGNRTATGRRRLGSRDPGRGPLAARPQRAVPRLRLIFLRRVPVLHHGAAPLTLSAGSWVPRGFTSNGTPPVVERRHLVRGRRGEGGSHELWGRASDLAAHGRPSRVAGGARGAVGSRRRLRPGSYPRQARHHPALWRPLA